MDAVLDDGFATFGQRAVTTLVDRHVENHRTRLHRLDGVFADQHRCFAAGNQGRGDNDIGLLGALMHQLGLTSHPVGRHLPCITANALGDFPFLIRDERHIQEFRAQRFDLFLHRRPHIGGLDYRAETLGSRDRLQTGNARAHDQHARRLDGTGGSHQHRHETLIRICRHQHRFVAGNVGLRRQYIHRLRA